MNSTALLQQLLQQAPENSLWCLGENSAELVGFSTTVSSVSNRFDLSQAIAHCQFSDFDFSIYADSSLDCIIFRIEKEKALNIHIIHQALHKLSAQGVFHLIGYKNEGIESLAKMLAKQTNSRIEKTKYKQLQHLKVSQATHIDIENHYAQLQEFCINDVTFLSKPGVFGWQKIDKGSALLVQALAEQGSLNPDDKILDLGCGYGYLSLQAKQLGFNHIDATDNNAAALIACQANFNQRQIKGKVFADHIAQQAVSQAYDIVLCNPPFHQGFAHSKQLIHDFCYQAHRVLKKHGQAWFVVNQFIGIEAIAKPMFSQVERLNEAEGFRIYRCSK